MTALFYLYVWGLLIFGPTNFIWLCLFFDVLAGVNLKTVVAIVLATLIGAFCWPVFVLVALSVWASDPPR
jgi:hypothetical protein